MTTDYDVIIVGGGMVGATLAVALAEDSSLSIAVIEAFEPKVLTELDKPDLRVSALTHASETLFKSLTIWQHLIPSRISTFTNMEVRENTASTLHFDSADIGEPLLGHIIENRHIQQACLARCAELKNIDLLCPAKPKSLSGSSLILEDGRTLMANLIVAADGAQSLLRKWANIDLRGWDYDQTAVVCTITTEKPHQTTAWQHFLPEGPLAFLPLSDPYQCSIVWSNSTEEAALLCALGNDEFNRAIHNAFGSKLGEFTHISDRASFPLKLRHAAHYVETGFALVGDAAHTIHPLAGQGVNIGLLDATTLAEVVIDAHQKKRDIGSLHTLNKYQRRRKGDNLAMQMTMDGFKRVFGSDIAPIQWVRRFALQTVNKHSLLKNIFMRQASGHRFANPRLSQKQHNSN